MKITRILTDRHFQTWPSWHIIYEWENEISESLNLPIVKSPVEKNFSQASYIHRKIKGLDNRIFQGKIEQLHFEAYNYTNEVSLYFEMHPVLKRNFSSHRRTIPVIVDYWSSENIELFKKIYRKCPYLLITSLEVLEFLKENKIKNKLRHFPMSLPKKYYLDPKETFQKKYDIVLAGRINPVLWDYLMQFEREHPYIEYLYQVHKNGELYYFSNKKGMVKKVQTRSEYINLIRAARVSFYATPGIDGGEERTNGFNPVTPRILELLSAGCHIIARYPKNADTDFFKLESICPSVNSYAQFKNQLKEALNSKQPIEKNSTYLLDHYTSTRVKILKEIK